MARNLLTADQTAARLGVKLPTVYAYVSRGILSRTVAADGRTSRFDAAEIEQLARRGRPRPDTRRAGTVDVVLATSLTGIFGDRLVYRGHDATELARTSSFEAVAELLWSGSLPDGAPGSSGSVDGRWQPAPGAPRTARAVAASLPESSPITERLAVVTAALACADPLRIDLQPVAVQAHARSLLTTLVTTLPVVARGGPARSRAAASMSPPDTALAALLWARLSPLAATAKRIRVLDAAMILLADHELATSTLAARVAASTRADPYAVVLSGLGAVSGLLHGAAGHAPYEMLEDARAHGSPERAVARALAIHGRVPGMGHPLYDSADPRASCLLELLHPLLGQRDRTTIDGVVAAATVTANAEPNIDLATAALAFAMQMPSAATEAIFDIARIAGWVAHAIEEYGEAPLRFRARALYAGPSTSRPIRGRFRSVNRKGRFVGAVDQGRGRPAAGIMAVTSGRGPPGSGFDRVGELDVPADPADQPLPPELTVHRAAPCPLHSRGEGQFEAAQAATSLDE
jgi:citrate synthase